MKKLLVMSATAAVLFAASAPAAFAADGNVTVNQGTDGAVTLTSAPNLEVTPGTFGFTGTTLTLTGTPTVAVDGDFVLSNPGSAKTVTISATPSEDLATAGVTLSFGTINASLGAFDPEATATLTAPTATVSTDAAKTGVDGTVVYDVVTDTVE
ncbi:MAG TPA: hypothetical protein VGM95_04400 [Lactobacillaceae bacterium]|jgi:hypothetical protein